MISKINNAEKVKCGVCGGLNCRYVPDEQNGDYRICLDCGYSTHTLYEIGSEYVDKYEKNVPRLIKELRKEDSGLNQYWYLSILHVTGKGLIYPIGSKEDWQWIFCPEKPIPIFDRLNYPIPGKENEYFESLPDYSKETPYHTFNTAYNELVKGLVDE